MRLIFEGQAIVERASDGVKFVGRYEDPHGGEQYVICRVSREALIARCQLFNPTPEALLAAYQAVRTEIHLLASVQYSGGIERPLIGPEDFARLKQRGSAAA
jgi:hypothetical protein